MNEKTKNAPRTDQEWKELIQECRTSGLGDKTWCDVFCKYFLQKNADKNTQSCICILHKIAEVPAAG